MPATASGRRLPEGESPNGRDLRMDVDDAPTELLVETLLDAPVVKDHVNVHKPPDCVLAPRKQILDRREHVRNPVHRRPPVAAANDTEVAGVARAKLATMAKAAVAWSEGNDQSAVGAIRRWLTPAS